MRSVPGAVATGSGLLDLASLSVLTRSLPLPVLTSWQPLDQVIETQPQRPTVMIEREWKREPNHEKNRQRDPFIKIGEEQGREINDDNQDLGGDHVRHNRADKKSLLALENHFAGGAAMF